ncbi:MAG: hypothetical protein MR031_00790 [Tenericutes bacterium]|nr:hypothetical protein [Mycoplasmatota bacterium]
MSSNMFINDDNVKIGVNQLNSIANRITDLNISGVASGILGVAYFDSGGEFEGDLDRLDYQANQIASDIVSTRSMVIDLSDSISNYIKADAGMKRVAVAEGALGVLEGLVDGIGSLIGQGALLFGHQSAADKIFSFVGTNWTGKLLDGAYSKYEANSTMTRDSEKLDLWKGIGSAAVYVGLAVAGPGLGFEAVTSGLAAHGQTVQASLQGGDDYQTALNKGYKAGAVAAVSEVVMDKGFAAAGKGLKKLIGKGASEVAETAGQKLIGEAAGEAAETAAQKAGGEAAQAAAQKAAGEAAETAAQKAGGEAAQAAAQKAGGEAAQAAAQKTGGEAAQTAAQKAGGEAAQTAAQKAGGEAAQTAAQKTGGEAAQTAAQKASGDAAQTAAQKASGDAAEATSQRLGRRTQEVFDVEVGPDGVGKIVGKSSREVTGEAFENAGQHLGGRAGKIIDMEQGADGVWRVTQKAGGEATNETVENMAGAAARNMDDAAEAFGKNVNNTSQALVPTSNGSQALTTATKNASNTTSTVASSAGKASGSVATPQNIPTLDPGLRQRIATSATNAFNNAVNAVKKHPIRTAIGIGAVAYGVNKLENGNQGNNAAVAPPANSPPEDVMPSTDGGGNDGGYGGGDGGYTPPTTTPETTPETTPSTETPTIPAEEPEQPTSPGGGGGTGGNDFSGEGMSFDSDTDDIESLEDLDIGEDLDDQIVTIPTTIKGVSTKNSNKSTAALPVLGALGVAAAAGIGAKVYMDNKANNTNDEEDEEYADSENSEINADEWNGDEMGDTTDNDESYLMYDKNSLDDLELGTGEI